MSVRNLLTPTTLSGVVIITSLVGFAISFRITNPYAISFSFAMVFAVIIAYILQHRKPVELTNSSESFSAKRLYILLFVLIVSLIMFYYSAGFTRSLPVHALTVLAYIMVVFIAIYSSNHIYTLVTAIGIAILHRGMIFYSSRSYIGNDVFAHNQRVEEMALLGTLEPLSESRYFFSPFYHIFTTVGANIINLPIRHTSFLLVTAAFTIVPALVVYTIVSDLVTKSAGIIGVLLYSAGDFPLRRSIQPTVTTLGAVFFAIAVYAVYMYITEGSKKHLLILFILISALALTHHLSLFVTVFITMLVFTLRIIYTGKIEYSPVNISILYGLILYIDFSITQTGGQDDGRSFFEFMIVRLLGHFTRADGRGSGVILPADAGVSMLGSSSLSLIHVAGTAVLLGAGIIGSVYLLSTCGKKGQYITFVFGGAFAIALSTVLAGPLLGMRTLIPWRWFLFLYLLLVILAAPAFIWAISVARHTLPNNIKLVAIIAVLILFAPYFILMGWNFAGAYEDPVFDSSPGAEKYTTTDSEYMLFSHVSQKNPDSKEVLADARAGAIMIRYFEIDYRMVSLDYQDPDSILDSRSDLLINRQYMRTHHAVHEFRYDNYTTRVHGKVPVDDVSVEKHSIIYSSGEHEVWDI